MDEIEDISEQLSAYLDGELSDAQKARVEAALLDSPALMRELAALRRTRELVRSLPTVKAPDDFATGVMDKAERRQLIAAASHVRARRFRWASLATAAVVLMVVGIGAVVTLTLTLTPPWTEKVARSRQRSVAVRPAEDKLRETAAASREALAAAYGVEPSAPGEAGDRTLALTGTDRRVQPSASGPARGVQEIGVMPPVAAAPGPRGDQPPGAVTQVGEPLYHGDARLDQAGPTSQLTPAAAPPQGEGERAKAARSLFAFGTARQLPGTPGATEGTGTAGSLVLGGPMGDQPAATSAPSAPPTSQPATRPGEPAFETLLADALGRPVNVVTTLSDVDHTYASAPEDFFGMKDGKAVFNGIVREMHEDRVTLVASADLQGTAVSDISAQNKVTIPRDAIVSIQRIPPTNQPAGKAGELTYASLFFREVERPIRVVTSLRGLRRTYASSPAGFFSTKDGKAVFTGFIRDPQGDKLILVASPDLVNTPVPEIPAKKMAAIPPDAILSMQAMPPTSAPASQPASAPNRF